MVHPSSSEAALATALDTLKSGDFQMRWEVVKPLTALGVEAIAPLIEILHQEDTDWELLWFVARILGNIKHPAAIAALTELLQTSLNSDVSGMAATALANQGSAAISSLTSLLNQDSTRPLAIQALAQIQHPDVIPALLSVVQDSSPTSRASALEALSHFRDPEISQCLLQGLTDTASSVRRAAVVGLGVQAQDDPLPAVAVLTPLLWDLNPDVAGQTAIALGRLGTDAATVALADVLRSPYASDALKLEAVRSLGWISSSAAINELELSLAQPIDSSQPLSEPVIQEVISVLGRIEHPNSKPYAAQVLIRALDGRDPAAQTPAHKQAIATSLGQLGQVEAIDALIYLLADSNTSVRLHAIAALKQLDAYLAHQRLMDLSHGDVPDPIKQGVAIALREWSY